LGFEFAGVIGLMFYLGYLADRRWGTDPWGLLIGGAVGLTAGIYHLAKEGNRMMRTLDAKPPFDRQDKGGTGNAD
jgi:F0F1-type ATP synthase assembly protein I